MILVLRFCLFRMWITLEITLQAWTLTKNTSDQSDSKWAETLINSKKLLQSRVSRDFVEIIVYFVCVSVLCFAKIWTLTKEKTLLNRTCAISRKKSQKWPTLMQFTKTKPEWRKGQPFWMIFTQHLFQTPLLSEVLEILQCKLKFYVKMIEKTRR